MFLVVYFISCTFFHLARARCGCFVHLLAHRGSPQELERLVAVGTPSNSEIVNGDFKIRYGDISTGEWCGILKVALREMRYFLKSITLSDFKSLHDLLNGPLLYYGTLSMAESALPSFKEANLKPNTRFLVLQRLELPETASDAKHEESWTFLLLTGDANFAFLELALFWQGDHYVVCSSSLVANSTVEGCNCVLDEEAPEIRDRIEDGSIHPYGILDHLRLVLGATIFKQEERLAETRRVYAVIDGMCNRIS